MNKINKNLIFVFIISLMINNQAAFGAEVKPAEEIKKEKKAQEKSLENPLEKYKLVVISAIIATILIGGGSAWYRFVRNKSLIKPIKRKPESQTISPTIPTKKIRREDEDKTAGKGPLPAADLALIKTLSEANDKEALMNNLKRINFSSKAGIPFKHRLKGKGLNDIEPAKLTSLIEDALDLSFEDIRRINEEADKRAEEYKSNPHQMMFKFNMPNF